MCGFAGFLTAGQFNHPDVIPILLKIMNSAITHRGPDAAGSWQDHESGIGLGHRRLSILELSEAGAQPMLSSCARYIIVFNGEIYNHLDLRVSLGNKSWLGHSDTETLLAGFSVWGIKKTIERCIGMFAISVWDRYEQVLILTRDRLGEKPLYYGWQGLGKDACFLFGSDLASIKVHPSFSADISRDTLALYMRHGAIGAPHTIYQGIYKLLPGHILTVSLKEKEPKLEQYWSLSQVAEQGTASPFLGTEKGAVNTLEALMMDAVQKQMLSDVPLGAFLSGGIDSSTVVALMQAQSLRPVRTFTIGFHEEAYNEAVHAKNIAKHLGTDHTELYVTPQQALDVIPKLAGTFTEPFADSSQIPTFLVSQLARQHVKVALSGDGGDELFAGYTRYSMAQDLWLKLAKIPWALRFLGAKTFQALPIQTWDKFFSLLCSFLPVNLSQIDFSNKLYKGAMAFKAKKIDELYLQMITHWEPTQIVLGANEPLTYLTGNKLSLVNLNNIQRLMVLDAITYLPDTILVKIDRAAMAASLETRAPFLDHRVVEFAWHLPQNMKIRDGREKWALRQVLYHHVPKELIDRPKMGFGVPIDSWLRGPLRDWAEALLDESLIRQQGYLDPAPIRKKWLEHLSGRQNWQYLLWNILMFQDWLQNEHIYKRSFL